MSKKKFWKLVGYGAIIAAISILTGALISYIFDYDPENYHFMIKAIIWAANIFVPYCIVVQIIKFFDKKLKFFNLWLLLFSYLISVIYILIIGGFDATYATTFVAIAGIVGTFYAIYKFAIKKKRTKKKLNNENEK